MFAFLLIIALAGVGGVRDVNLEVLVPLNKVAVVGEAVQLYCKYYSTRCNSIRWQKNSTSGRFDNISDGNKVSDRRYRLDNSSVCLLVIDRVTTAHAGTFICTFHGRTDYEPGIADLIVLNQKPSCSTTCKNDSTVETEAVNFKCQVKGIGEARPVMSWFDSATRREYSPVPGQSQDKTSVSRDFSWIPAVPGFEPLICLTRFYFVHRPGRAPNVPEVQCQTDSCNILYSVRNAVTSPAWKASPGETITCKANGNPEPELEWQSNDGDGEWEDVEDETSETIVAFLNNGTSSTNLRCVAKNKVKGNDFIAHSAEVSVSTHGGIIRIATIVGVIVGIVILVVIAGVVYKFCFSG